MTPVTGHPAAYSNSTPPPPPQAVSGAVPHPRPRPRHHASGPTACSQTAHIVRCLISALVFLLVLVCASVAVAWLCLHPRPPFVTLDSFAVSNFTSFKIHLVGQADVNLTVGNPNKKLDLRLESFEVIVTYRPGKVVLSKTPMEDLYVEKKGETVSEGNLDFAGRHGISKCDKVLGDSEWNMRNGSVRLDVEILFTAKFRAGDWLSTKKSITALCNGVELSRAHNGTGELLEGRKPCIVGEV